MTALRTLSFAFLTIITIYTVAAIANDGFDLITPFISDILGVGWSGQFNLDFMMYLILSALWVAWRHDFSGAGIALAAIASVGGMLFFATYLLVQIGRAKGDVERLALGDRRAAARK